MIAKARAAAPQLQPRAQQRALNALKELDALLPAQEAAAKDLARNPRDPSKKGKLSDLNAKIARNLDTLAEVFGAAAGPGVADEEEIRQLVEKEKKSVDDTEGAALKGGPLGVQAAANAANEANNTHSQLAPRAIAHAQRPSAPPNAHKQVTAALGKQISDSVNLPVVTLIF